MKITFLLTAFLAISAVAQEGAIDPERIANTIILDETGVQNLRIKTAVAEERDFETTIFAIGRIEEIPANRSVLSSRISGRVVEINAFEGDMVKKGQILAKVESRQPGNPPPTINLTAPQDGLVVSSHVRIGQPVEPANELLDISDRSTIWAVAKVPENEASKITVGTKARIHIPALGDQLIDANLIRYGINADSESGTIEAIFPLNNEDARLQPGMRVEFSIIAATRPNVLAVPRTAIQGSATNRVVFVKDFQLENAFIKAPVALGTRNEEFVEVLNGIFPGDEVVTQGSYPLSFASPDTGISLKEALDAAHGHEHNEDGSEITPEQLAEQEATEHGHEHHEHHGTASKLFLVYSITVTIALLICLQMIWKNRTNSQDSC